jgi:hypothetical protein
MLANSIFTKLIDGKGHYIVMNTYFTSGRLFKEWSERKTYATRTLQINRVEIPIESKNT